MCFISLLVLLWLSTNIALLKKEGFLKQTFAPVKLCSQLHHIQQHSRILQNGVLQTVHDASLMVCKESMSALQEQDWIVAERNWQERSEQQRDISNTQIKTCTCNFAVSVTKYDIQLWNRPGKMSQSENNRQKKDKCLTVTREEYLWEPTHQQNCPRKQKSWKRNTTCKTRIILPFVLSLL